MSKRVVKSSKIFFYDSGLLCYLLGVNEKNISKEPRILGHIFENFVIQELLKMATWSSHQVDFFYYRDHSKVEVDLILEIDNSCLIPIEIKAKRKLTSKDKEGVEKLRQHSKFKRGFIFYLGDEIIPFGKDILALPISCLFPA